MNDQLELVKPRRRQWDAGNVIKLLAERHKDDVFVPECKDGPSHGSMVKMDAWAMAKSWARPHVFGYEVKVSRNDFIRDNKWPAYLPMCNSLYFVAPRDVIRLEECPEGCGLIWLPENGNRLTIKRKAPYREIVIPEEVYRYILMCRARIVGSDFSWRTTEPTREERLEKWRRWLEEHAESRELGHTIRGKVALRCNEIMLENERLKAENATYSEVKEILQELGFLSVHRRYLSAARVKERAEELMAAVPVDLLPAIDRLQDALVGFSGRLTALQQKANQCPTNSGS